jgi:hypothetical protein
MEQEHVGVMITVLTNDVDLMIVEKIFVGVALQAKSAKIQNVLVAVTVARVMAGRVGINLGQLV